MKLVLLVFVFAAFELLPVVEASKFCMANQMTIYGTIASNKSVTTVQECAYSALESATRAFGWDGSSQCQIFSAITGYAETADPLYKYYIQDDSYAGTTCMNKDTMIPVIRDLVYDGQNCPTGFTYNSGEQVCQSTMSKAACDKYSATWAFPYMSLAATPCVLYPSTQTTSPADYFCNNYLATVQIFKGTAYCYAAFSISNAQASDPSIISNDGCNYVFDPASNVLIPGSMTEVDWLYAKYGQVMIGAYLKKSPNTAANYFFRDDNSASSFVTGTLNGADTTGFLYTDGSKVTSATKIPQKILICKATAIIEAC